WNQVGGRPPNGAPHGRIPLPHPPPDDPRLASEDRQHHARWVLDVHIDLLLGLDVAGMASDRLAGVRVPVKTREVGARHIDAYPVTRCESVGRRRQEYGDLRYFPLLEEDLTVESVAVPGADDRIRQAEVVTIRIVFVWRVNVYEFRSEVGVDGTRRDPQVHPDPSDHFDRFSQLFGLEYKYVLSIRQPTKRGAT